MIIKESSPRAKLWHTVYKDKGDALVSDCGIEMSRSSWAQLGAPAWQATCQRCRIDALKREIQRQKGCHAGADCSQCAAIRRRDHASVGRLHAKDRP